jgi:hypothetical protein
LPRFPNKLGPSDKHLSLTDYDVIIAIDPDWTALTLDELEKVKLWVGNHSGGLVFVAGPVHTFHLARPGGFDLSAIKTIYPVELKDSRLEGLGIGHDPTRPYYLEFTKEAVNFDFLKIEETAENPIEAWDRFFWSEGKNPEPGQDIRPVRGFYSYYPVEKLRPDSTVIASFIGPKPKDLLQSLYPQPYMVQMKYGSGKTMHIGSSETWRMRGYKEAYHERLWIKLARYMSAGTTPQKKYGYIPLPRFVQPGNLQFEAQLKGEDLDFMPPGSTPIVKVKRPADATEPAEFTLRAKPVQGSWNGWFQATYRIKNHGDYEFKIEIPGEIVDDDGVKKTGIVGVVEHTLTVRKPDLENDNKKNNFTPLYQIATSARGIMDRARDKNKDADKTKDVELLLKASAAKVEAKDQKDDLRLFFNFPNAHEEILPKLIIAQPPDVEQTKSKLTDLWDSGLWEQGQAPFWTDAYVMSILAPFILGLVAMGILMLTGRYIEGGIAGGAGAVVALFIAFVPNIFMEGERDWGSLEVNLSVVLITVVGLLSIEWLTRKLLKLA